MPRPVALPLTLVLLLALAGCGVVPQPAPTDTSSPGAVGEDESPPVDAEVHGWLLEAHDNFMAGTMRMCADDPVITDPHGEYAGATVEADGGPPDSWVPGDPWEIGDGIQLDFVGGTYYLYFADGDTYYEFNGSFDYAVDDDGVPTSGEGTGSGRILHPNGDVESDVPDIIALSFSEIPEPTWCKYSYDEDGNLIEE